MPTIKPPDGGASELPPGAEPYEPVQQEPFKGVPGAGLPAGAEPVEEPLPPGAEPYIDEGPVEEVWRPLNIAEGEMPTGVYTADEKREEAANRLRMLKQNGKFLNPSDAAVAFEVSSALKVPMDTVMANVPAWKEALKDKDFDAGQLIEKDPVLAKAIDESPYLAPLVDVVQEPSLAAKAAAVWRWFQSGGDFEGMAGGSRVGSGFEAYKERTKDQVKLDDIMPQRQEIQAKDSSGADLGQQSIFSREWKQAKLAEEYHQLGAQALALELQGKDASAKYAEAQRIGLQLQPEFYGEQAGLGIESWTAQNVYPLWSFYKAGAKTGAPSYLATAGLTLLATKGQFAKAHKIGKKVGSIAMEMGMFEQAASDAAGRYNLSLLTATTPDGNPIEPEVRRGMALIFGVAEGAVMTFGMSYMTKRLGKIGEAAISGEQKRMMALLASREFVATAKRIGKSLGKEMPTQFGIGFGTGYFQNVLEQAATLGAMGVTDKPFDDSGLKGGPGFWSYMDQMDYSGKPVETGLHMAVANSLMLAASHATIPAAVEAAKLPFTLANAHAVSKVTGVARSKVGLTMPGFTAKIIKRQFAEANGKEVSHIYWDVREFVDSFGEQSEQVAIQLLGPDGDVQLAEAIGGRDNAKLAIPLEKYVEAANKTPQLIDKMAPNATVDPMAESIARRFERIPAMLEEANRMVEEYKNKPDNVVEKRLAKFRAQIEEAAKKANIEFSPEELDSIVDTQRAFVHTLAVNSKGAFKSEDIVNELTPEVFTPDEAEIQEVIKLNNDANKRQAGITGEFSSSPAITEQRARLIYQRAPFFQRAWNSIVPGAGQLDWVLGWLDPNVPKTESHRLALVGGIKGRETARKTTILHELGHSYLFGLERLVREGRAPEYIQRDMNSLVEWITGIGPNEAYKSYLGLQAKTPSGIIGVIKRFVSVEGEVEVEVQVEDGKLILVPVSELELNIPAHLAKSVSNKLMPEHPDMMHSWSPSYTNGWKFEWHEKFAVAFEHYLATGQAPSAKLLPAFTRFRIWYMQVFGTFAGRHLTKYASDLENKQIKPILDRMLATDAEMRRMALWRKERTLFKTPEEAGITDPIEWQRYVEQAADWYNETVREADKESIKDAAKVLKAGKKEITDYVAEEIERNRRKDPMLHVWYALQFGEFYDDNGNVVDTLPGSIKFDRKSVEQVLGRGFDTAIEQFVSDDPKVSKMNFQDFLTLFDVDAHNLPIIIRDGLMHEPTKEARQAYAERKAEAIAAHLAGSFMDDAVKLEEMVADSMHNRKDKEWLVRELNILRGKFGQGGVKVASPLDAIKKAAKDIFETMMWKDLDYRKILAQERRAAEEALEAAAKGEYEAAFNAKKQQLLYSHLYDMVREARTEVSGYRELVKRQMQKDRRSILGHGAPEIGSVLDQLAEAVGIRNPDATDKSARADVAEAVAYLTEEKLEPAFDPKTVQRLIDNPKPIDEYTVQELRDAIAATKQLWTIGRKKFRTFIKGKEVEYTKLFADMLSEQEPTPPKEQYPKKTHGFWKWAWNMRTGMSGIFASMTEPELIFERLGPTATALFWDKYVESRNFENALAERVLDPLLKTWRNLPDELKKRQFDVIDVESLPWDRRTERDRTWLWMVMLNWGNDGNRKRLLDGYGWKEAQVEQFFLDNNVTKAEWDFVQSIWDIYESTLWPEAQKAYERVNGVKPRGVVATPIKNEHGTYRGGYFPAKYEVIQGHNVGKFTGFVTDANMASLKELYDEIGAALSMTSAFTMNRSKVTKPRTIDLDWSVVPAHTSNVVHYIAFDEAIRSMMVMARNDDFKNLVRSRLGNEYVPQLNAWLYVLATGKNASANEALRWWHKAIRWGRGGLVINTLGYNVGVAMGDMVTPLTAVTVGKEAGGVDARYLSGSLIRALGDLKDAAESTVVQKEFESMRARALKHSKELGTRSSRLRHQLNEELRAIGGEARHLPTKALAAVREHAWFFMEWSDLLSSTIIWDAAFEQHLAEQRDRSPVGPLDFAAAAKDADKRVRTLMPSHVIAEQPSMLRDRHSIGALMAFYTYFNKLFNMGRRVWHDPYVTWHADTGPVGDNPEVGSAAWNKLAKAGKLSKSVAMATGRTVATLAVANVMGELLSGRGKEEDEKWGQWLARKSLASPALLVPFVGTAAEEVINQKISGKHRPFSVRTAPALAPFETMLDAYHSQGSSKRDAWEKFWRWNDVAGAALHLPGRQVSKTGSYVQRVVQGKVRPRGLADMAGGLTYGQRTKKPKNPLVLLQDLTSSRKQ